MSSLTPIASDTASDVRRRYQRIAPLYDLLDLPFEYSRYRRIRPLLFQGLSGRLLDAGVGTGRNMPFYPPGSEVIGIDLSPAMLRRAQLRRAHSPASVQLVEMDVSRLSFPSVSFDAAVASFLFCTLPSDLQTPALRELGRVVRPHGRIRLLDYTRPEGRIRRVIAQFWEPWIASAFGARFDHQTERHISDAGLMLKSAHFVVDDLIRLIEATPAD